MARFFPIFRAFFTAHSPSGLPGHARVGARLVYRLAPERPLLDPELEKSARMLVDSPAPGSSRTVPGTKVETVSLPAQCSRYLGEHSSHCRRWGGCRSRSRRGCRRGRGRRCGQRSRAGSEKEKREEKLHGLESPRSRLRATMRSRIAWAASRSTAERRASPACQTTWA